jgi:hypothetical protein
MAPKKTSKKKFPPFRPPKIFKPFESIKFFWWSSREAPCEKKIRGVKAPIQARVGLAYVITNRLKLPYRTEGGNLKLR